MIFVNRLLWSISAQMSALTWKAVFASLNPSPVFEVVAAFAEGLAMDDDESPSQKSMPKFPVGH